MTETTLTVPTNFTDISELAEGMADRVDAERLMLYGPGPIADNSWVRFEILLADQSVAVLGLGRAVASIDGGEERDEMARYDVVLDMLQFEGKGEVVYERMLMVSQGAFSGEQVTGEISVDQLEEVHGEYEAAQAAAGAPPVQEGEPEAAGWEAEASDVAAVDDVRDPSIPPPTPEEPAYAAEPVHADADAYDDATYAEPAETYGSLEGVDEVQPGDVQDLTSLPPSAPEAEPPPRPGGFVLEPPTGANGRVLARPSRQSAWYPEDEPPPEPRPSTGLFLFSGGLPVPGGPPRPDLDPTLRIAPAPRPAEAATAEHVAPAMDVTAEHPMHPEPSGMGVDYADEEATEDEPDSGHTYDEPPVDSDDVDDSPTSELDLDDVTAEPSDEVDLGVDPDRTRLDVENPEYPPDE